MNDGFQIFDCEEKIFTVYCLILYLYGGLKVGIGLGSQAVASP